eukprot:2338902-Pyramimonas_sp.AAC.1
MSGSASTQCGALTGPTFPEKGMTPWRPHGASLPGGSVRGFQQKSPHVHLRGATRPPAGQG